MRTRRPAAAADEVGHDRGGGRQELLEVVEDEEQRLARRGSARSASATGSPGVLGDADRRARSPPATSAGIAHRRQLDEHTPRRGTDRATASATPTREARLAGPAGTRQGDDPRAARGAPPRPPPRLAADERREHRRQVRRARPPGAAARRRPRRARRGGGSVAVRRSPCSRCEPAGDEGRAGRRPPGERRAGSRPRRGSGRRCRRRRPGPRSGRRRRRSRGRPGQRRPSPVWMPIRRRTRVPPSRGQRRARAIARLSAGRGASRRRPSRMPRTCRRPRA